MNVLFDTDVLLDVLLDREPFSASSSQVLSMAEEGSLRGYVCATSVTTIFYLGQRFQSSRHLSRSLLPAGGVAPPRQIPNMPASARLASEQNDLELGDSNFGNAGLGTKAAGRREARKHVSVLLSILEVAPVNRSVLEDATSSRIRDFEDAVVASAGKAVAADIILTRNVKDFKMSEVTVSSPAHFLAAITAGDQP